MNKYAINAAELNGAGIHNTIVSLGAVAIEVDFFLYEHISPELSGSAGIVFDAYGDLSKLVQIGTASAGITFSTTAVLTQYSIVNIGAAPATIAFTVTGDLTQYARTLLGTASAGVTFSEAATLYSVRGMAGAAEVDFTVTGTLAVRGNLVADTTVEFTVTDLGMTNTVLLGPGNEVVTFDVTGDLTQYVLRYLPDAVTDVEFDVTASLTQHVIVFLPSGSAPLVFDVTGTLTQYGTVLIGAVSSGVDFNVAAALTQLVRLSGAAEVDFDVTGDLVTIVRMSGATGFTISTDATLFNNPAANDPEAFVLTRPFVDRVMVRQ